MYEGIEAARQAARQALESLGQLRRACRDIHGAGALPWDTGSAPAPIAQSIESAKQEVRWIQSEIEALTRGMGSLAV